MPPGPSDPRLWLGASLQSRDGTITKDALVTNAFLEKTGEHVTTLKRGGLNLVTALGSGSGQGITNFIDANGLEILYAVNGSAIQVANVLNGGGVWASRADTGFGTDGAATFSFGGFLWSVGGDVIAYSAASYYASTVSGAATLAASSIWGGGGLAGMCPLVVGAAVYLLGGHTGQSAANTTDDVWKTANGTTFTKITAAAAFGSRTYIKGAVLGSTMYYLGGQDTGGAYDNNVYSSTDGITWTLVTATPNWGGAGASLRTRFGVTTYQGKIWVMGGLVNGTRKNDVWYSTDGNTWTQATASAAWGARTDPSVYSLSSGATLALVGGLDGSGQNYSVYTSTDGITWTVGTSVSGVTFLTSSVSRYGTHKNLAWISSTSSGLNYSTNTTTSGVSLGSLVIGANDMVDFAKNLDGTQIMARSNLSAFKIAPATQTLTQITDAQYPTVTVRGCAYLDGVFYVMAPDGTISGSDDEDCTAWTSTNFVTAEFEPDEGVCLAKYNNYIVAFGQWTTQMFWDANIAPPASALAPVQNGVLLIGCAHANSVAQIESTLIWMAQRKGQGSSFQQGRFIAMLEGQSYVEVSTPDINRVLNADDLATIYSCVASFAGHDFYILGLGTTGASVVYDLREKLWYVWTRTATGTNVSITALTQSNGLATATAASHGFSDGDPITISGAAQAGYNLTQVNISRVDANTFTYPVASATVSPATGTILATPYTESYFSVCASCNYQGEQVFQDVSGGNIFEMLSTVFRDNALPINMKIRTSNQDSGTNRRKFASSVTPDCDLPSSTQTALLRVTDDDYQTYSLYRSFDISDVAPHEHRWGTYRRRAWEWRYTGNTAHRIRSLEIEKTMEK